MAGEELLAGDHVGAGELLANVADRGACADNVGQIARCSMVAPMDGSAGLVAVSAGPVVP
ncbi:hypothetical protein ACWEP4_39925 [Streptomyces sp. NPDC004227]